MRHRASHHGCHASLFPPNIAERKRSRLLRLHSFRLNVCSKTLFSAPCVRSNHLKIREAFVFRQTMYTMPSSLHTFSHSQRLHQGCNVNHVESLLKWKWTYLHCRIFTSHTINTNATIQATIEGIHFVQDMELSDESAFVAPGQSRIRRVSLGVLVLMQSP